MIQITASRELTAVLRREERGRMRQPQGLGLESLVEFRNIKFVGRNKGSRLEYVGTIKLSTGSKLYMYERGLHVPFYTWESDNGDLKIRTLEPYAPHFLHFKDRRGRVLEGFMSLYPIHGRKAPYKEIQIHFSDESEVWYSRMNPRMVRRFRRQAVRR